MPNSFEWYVEDWKKRSFTQNLTRAQSDFNKLRRMENADEFGICTCVVTGKRFHYKKIDAGHFIAVSGCSGLRFEPLNVWPQSKASNQYQNSNSSQIWYTIFMVEKIGADGVRKLLDRAEKMKRNFKWDPEDVIRRRIEWKERIKLHEKRLAGY